MRNYCYINAEKVESYFSQINGCIITESKVASQKKLKGVSKFGLETGSLLAKLGIAKGQVEGKISRGNSKTLEITTALTVYNKIDFLLEYLNNCGSLGYIELKDYSVERSKIDWTARGIDLHVVFGRFHGMIQGVSDQETYPILHEIFLGCHTNNKEEIALRERNLNWKAKLASRLTVSDDCDEPLVTVPLFLGNITQNQGFVCEFPIPRYYEIIGNALMSERQITVNPLAISMMPIWYRPAKDKTSNYRTRVSQKRKRSYFHPNFPLSRK